MNGGRLLSNEQTQCLSIIDGETLNQPILHWSFEQKMTSTYRPNESKREEFRRYLEKGGVVDAITSL